MTKREVFTWARCYAAYDEIFILNAAAGRASLFRWSLNLKMRLFIFNGAQRLKSHDLD